jgi:hypothetical protein
MMSKGGFAMTEGKPTSQTDAPAEGHELTDQDLSTVAGGTGGLSSEDMALRFQILVQKRKQGSETLSNILKPFEPSQSDLVANLK